MRRKAEVFLQEWQNKTSRKPLIIRGARQVGKSTLVRQFAAHQNLNFIEINLEKLRHKISFSSNDVQKIIREIEVYTRKSFTPNNTLLFIDEIQEDPAAIESLRYFFEERPDLFVIAAGSLLEFTFHEHTFSMPVGRVEFYHLGPMTFSEYLDAMGDIKILTLLNSDPVKTALEFHAHLEERLHEYYFLGGMPAVIAEYINEKSFLKAREVQQSILETYRLDFPKYSNKNQSIRLGRLLDRVTHFIGEKVKYSELLPDEKHPAIRKTIELLKNAKIIHCCIHTNAIDIPLSTHSDESVFKIYLLDVGLMNTLLEIEWNEIKERINTKGKQAEQFIAQHLVNQQTSTPQIYYWLRDKKSNNAEVDFIIKHNNEVIPIEVKSGKSGKIRSLEIIMNENKLKKAIRFDLKQRNVNEIQEHKKYLLYNLPIYLVEWLHQALQKVD